METSLAANLETMKQDLVSQFDFRVAKVDVLLDDANLGFIDIVALRRFLKKCGVLASNSLLLSIIRRFDLDQDTRLS